MRLFTFLFPKHSQNLSRFWNTIKLLLSAMLLPSLVVSLFVAQVTMPAKKQKTKTESKPKADKKPEKKQDKPTKGKTSAKKGETSQSDYQSYSIADDPELEKLDDEDYRIVRKRVEARKKLGFGPSEIDRIDTEVRKIEANKERREAAEAKRQNQEFQKASAKRRKELERIDAMRKDIREDIEGSDEEAFPVISDDEIRWNGLYD